MEFTPGKLYKCISANKNSGSPHFSNPCEYILDYKKLSSYGHLKKDDVIMFIENIWIPNVMLHKFFYKNKIIFISSYHKNWFKDVFVEL